jgi:hypothetical protein
MPERGALIELDFGDDEFVVRQHEDGLYTLTVAGGRLLVNEEQFRAIVEAVVQIGRMKLWIASPDGVDDQAVFDPSRRHRSVDTP